MGGQASADVGKKDETGEQEAPPTFKFDPDANEKVQATEAAFAEAFKNDQTALEGIRNMVAELESHGQKPQVLSAAASKQAQAEAFATRKLEKDVSKKAQADADGWLRKQTLFGSNKTTNAPLIIEEEADMLPPPAPKPMIYGWETPSMGQFLDDPNIVTAWGDGTIGPTLRELLNRIKENPKGTHGMHPMLKDLLEIPRVADLLKKARAELSAKPKSAASKGAVPEYYALLAVSVDATFEEIKKGYRKQALKWHPDKNSNSDESKDMFQRINKAFDVLFDPEARERYDSGEAALPEKAKKLAGHGWAKFADDDEEVMTKEGLRYRMWSWSQYRNSGGRIDDDPNDLVFDSADPRYPELRKKLFWRMVGQKAWDAREEWEEDTWDKHLWVYDFIKNVWKDTPNRWPKGPELKKMGKASQEEWKERRMVYNRRKHKVLLNLELWEDYLDIPDREEKERARFMKMFPKAVEFRNSDSSAQVLRA